MKNNQVVLTIVAVAIVGGAAFFGGMKYQQHQLAASRQAGTNGQTAGFAGRTGTGTRGAAANGLRPVVGQILSQDATSMTVKLADGSSKIVLLPAVVTYSKTSTGAQSDLKVGDQVGVFGATNSDGSVTAQSVQENPNFGMLRGLGATQSATPTVTPATK